MIYKFYITFALLFFLINCTSLKNNAVGTWKLTAEINSENPSATRSSLKETKIESDKKLIFNKDSSFTSNLSLCNEYNESGIYLSKGIYTFKKNKNPDKLFWIKCPGVYPIHYFIIKEKKLELYFPSFGSGYRIKIFEK